MKKVFKTLSAILLATACLTPGLAWADTLPSVELKDTGALKASDMVDVHSVLVEMQLSDGDVARVTDVVLENAPSNAMSSAVYDSASQKVTIAVSSGKEVIDLNNGSLGTVSIVAEGASAAAPATVNAHLTALEYIADEDSRADVLSGTVNPNTLVTLKITKDAAPVARVNDTNDGNGDGFGDNGQGNNGNGNGSGADDFGNGAGDGSGLNGNEADGSNATRTADYRASGVVTQAGQSTANSGTGLVKTGDVLLICGIGLVVAAGVVFIAMGFARKKGSSRK